MSGALCPPLVRRAGEVERSDTTPTDVTRTAQLPSRRAICRPRVTRPRKDYGQAHAWPSVHLGSTGEWLFALHIVVHVLRNARYRRNSFGLGAQGRRHGGVLRRHEPLVVASVRDVVVDIADRGVHELRPIIVILV